MLKQGLQYSLFIILLSFFVGSLSSIFLLGLQYFSQLRIEINLLWLFLPLAGIIFQFIKKQWPTLSSSGTNDYLIIIQKKLKKTDSFFSIYSILSTWLSHLAGASVGREGTAVQVGASIAEQLSTIFKFSKNEKAIWIRAGLAAGFSSVFGTPLAGTLFGLEINKVGNISILSIIPCLISSFGANWISLHVYNTKHLVYPSIFLPSQTPQFWLHIFILGLFLGLIGYIYKSLESAIYKLSEQLPTQFILKGIISGLIIYLILQVPTFQTSIGLGSEKLLEPFNTQFEKTFFANKLIATATSLGLGFKGGEATPLFLIGSHAGAFLSTLIPIPIALAAAIGFIALYCGLGKLPITGMFLGIELFTYQAWYIFLITTLIVIYTSGKKGLFTAQQWSDKLPKPKF